MSGDALYTLRQFWAWWRDELLACVPQRLRDLAVRHIPRALIRADAHGVDVLQITGTAQSHYQDDTMLRDLHSEGWDEVAGLIAERRARLVLDAPLSFQRDLPLPRGSWANARRVLDLQLSRIAPIDPDGVAWSWTAEARHGAMWATIAMVRRADIIAIDAACTARGIADPTIAVPGPSGLIIVRQGEDGSMTPARARDRRWMLAALALLAATPLLSLGAMTMARGAVAGDIAVLSDEVGPKLAARTRADRARQALVLLRPVLSQPSVSAISEALANALPARARLDMLMVNDSGLVQVDVRGSDAATLESVLTPLFRDVRIVENGAGASGAMPTPAATAPAMMPSPTPDAAPVAAPQSPTGATQSPPIRVEIRP